MNLKSVVGSAIEFDVGAHTEDVTRAEKDETARYVWLLILDREKR
jgi:hypothetical protein